MAREWRRCVMATVQCAHAPPVTDARATQAYSATRRTELLEHLRTTPLEAWPDAWPWRFRLKTSVMGSPMHDSVYFEDRAPLQSMLEELAALPRPTPS